MSGYRGRTKSQAWGREVLVGLWKNRRKGMTIVDKMGVPYSVREERGSVLGMKMYLKRK